MNMDSGHFEAILVCAISISAGSSGVEKYNFRGKWDEPRGEDGIILGDTPGEPPKPSPHTGHIRVLLNQIEMESPVIILAFILNNSSDTSLIKFSSYNGLLALPIPLVIANNTTLSWVPSRIVIQCLTTTLSH